MPRFRTAAVAAVATSLLLAPTAAYAHPGGHGDSGERSSSRSRLAYERHSGALTDLDPVVRSALDGASASATMFGVRSTFFYLRVEGINEAAAGQRFGAHLHTGPCRTGLPLEAGGHYNVQLQANIIPAAVSPDTEVWLDFRVNSDGEARSTESVPFVPTVGERSIVIHRDPTMDSGAGVGTAGPRVACLPFDIG